MVKPLGKKWTTAVFVQADCELELNAG